MRTIWKFPLSVAGVQDVEMPRGARILTVQPQAGKVCLWALVESEGAKEPRRIAIIGTGHTVPEYGRLVHISTFQLHGGELIFHVFEITDDCM